MYHEHPEIVLLTVFIFVTFDMMTLGAVVLKGQKQHKFWHVLAIKTIHMGSTKHFLMHIKNHVASVLLLPVLASFNVP